MKRIFSLLLTACLVFPMQAFDVIPAPVKVTVQEGTPNLRRELSRKIGKKAFANRTAQLPAWAQEEAYLLTVTPKGYKVEANTETGYFRALQTLAQVDECCEVFDYPRFPYRGFMLDVSRHFRDKDFILKQMKALASVKLNRLHLHLTDDAGWRLQIDRYPRLTSRAAWREGAAWETWNTTGRRYADEGSPDASGGYLTKADIREILALADELEMEVIPEIEMPGHSREVIFAYPELGCKAGSEEFCPGKEATFVFLENVLEEVIGMFPSAYIHIGGDEASKRDWAQCPDCQARMQAEGLTSVEELQSYLVRRIERFLNAKGRHLIGWDEILEGGLSPNATVMSWRGTEGGIQAMREGHYAIMTPGQYCYINNAQDAPVFEPSGQGGYLPLDAVYGYDPLEGIPESLHPLMMGLQANLWQEYVVTPEHTEYMMYPRVAAIAERAWSPGKSADFRERVIRWNDALAQKGYHVFDVRKERGERKAFREGVSHLAVGKPARYATPWHNSYPSGREKALTDGLCGGWSFGDGRWQGFLSDVDVTVDLQQTQDIHYLGATFLCQPGPEIFLPSDVEFWISTDGEHYTRALLLPNEYGQPAQAYVVYGATVREKARYVRMLAHRSQAWLFVDEIVVN